MSLTIRLTVLAAAAALATQSFVASPDWSQVGKSLGKDEAVQPGGIYQFSIPRAAPIKEQGMGVAAATGTAIAINFQPTGSGKVAITSDFVLISTEVNPVLKAMRDHGIEITALPSHMLDEEPRVFFMHFWANSDAETLARGLRTAPDKMDLKRS